jgi:hypothetical protein
MDQLEEVDQCINILNEEIYADSGYDTPLSELIEVYGPFDMMSNGGKIILRFMFIEIWNSDDDPRTLSEDGMGYTETIMQYVRRRTKDVIGLIASIKL